MLTVNLAQADQVVARLNTPAPAAELKPAFTREYLTRGAAIGPEWDVYLGAMVGEKLRSYVDEWLQTGVRNDGSEHPR